MNAKIFNYLLKGKYGEDLYYKLDYLEQSFQDELKEEFGIELVDRRDDIQYDSYGNENSEFFRVFKVEGSNQYFRIRGVRQSYSGLEWLDAEEVNKKEVVIVTWE